MPIRPASTSEGISASWSPRPGCANTGTPPARRMRRTASSGASFARGTWPGFPFARKRSNASRTVFTYPRRTLTWATWGGPGRALANDGEDLVGVDRHPELTEPRGHAVHACAPLLALGSAEVLEPLCLVVRVVPEDVDLATVHVAVDLD